MSEPINPQSPTGNPKLKPRRVKWWLAATIGLVAGLEVAAQELEHPQGKLACRISAIAIAAAMGSASPGFRKP